MASNSPGGYSVTTFPSPCHSLSAHCLPEADMMLPHHKDSGYYVTTSDGASTCSSSTTEASLGGDLESAKASLGAEGEGGTLLVLEPKSLRSFTTNDEYLYAMKEDLADWFTCLYKVEVTADTFLNVLETGVLLCQHANKVQDFAKQRRQAGEALEMRSYFIRAVPEAVVPYREGVRPETFPARDNVSNFISWSRSLGIPDVLSFETDDLVLRKNEKSVILCLLEIARVGAKLGMLAPTLVQMEEEIDAELAGEEPPAKPQVQIKTNDLRSLDERASTKQPQAGACMEGSTSDLLPSSSESITDSVHDDFDGFPRLVRDLIGRCTCPVQFPMQKVGEGKYKIGDSRSLIFVRILRNHVMVRVGGGWDTLENYLNKHDPCQCNYRGHRAGSAQPGVTHKVTGAPTSQRRASMPGQMLTSRPATTPSSPSRRVSTAASPSTPHHATPHHAPHARSASPVCGKSPSLIISRHNQVKPTTSRNNNQVGGATSASETNQNGNNNSGVTAVPNRSISPGPGRLRSPSPIGTPTRGSAPSPAPTGIPTRPSVLRTSSSSALLKGQDAKGKSTFQRLKKSPTTSQISTRTSKIPTRTSKIPTIVVSPCMRTSTSQPQLTSKLPSPSASSTNSSTPQQQQQQRSYKHKQ